MTRSTNQAMKVAILFVAAALPVTTGCQTARSWLPWTASKQPSVDTALVQTQPSQYMPPSPVYGQQTGAPPTAYPGQPYGANQGYRPNGAWNNSGAPAASPPGYAGAVTPQPTGRYAPRQGYASYQANSLPGASIAGMSGRSFAPESTPSKPRSFSSKSSGSS